MPSHNGRGAADGNEPVVQADQTVVPVAPGSLADGNDPAPPEIVERVVKTLQKREAAETQPLGLLSGGLSHQVASSRGMDRSQTPIGGWFPAGIDNEAPEALAQALQGRRRPAHAV